MKKPLIITVVASFFLAACSSDPVVNRLPWVYRIDVQQGNVFTQEDVNQLQYGMSKRQVLFILGYPMVTDPFHANRWDYYYEYKPGTEGKEKKAREMLSLNFSDDELVGITGTMQPQAQTSTDKPAAQVSVIVPPREREDPGILTRLWRRLSFRHNH